VRPARHVHKGAASIFHHPNLPDRRQWRQQFSGPAQDGLACIVIARRWWQVSIFPDPLASSCPLPARRKRLVPKGTPVYKIRASMSKLPITYDDVVAAHQRISGVAHRTPVLTSATANDAVGASLFFKCENFQRVGAFKFRGAYNAIAQFSPGQRAAGVIAYSSGNHAQAIALSARLQGINSVIVMPSDAPAIKIAATRGYGSEVILYDRLSTDRQALGRCLAEERGLTLIPPYDHPHVMAGQGTAAKELFEDAGPLDVLVVPLGGGGLLSGCAVAARAFNPQCWIVGVEPEAGNDGQRSFRGGIIVHIDVPRTIADGAQTQHLGLHPFAVIRQLVDDVVTVSDAKLVEAMRFFANRMKLVVEPTGCLAAAAVLQRKIDARGKRIGVLVSGGNIDPARFAELLPDPSRECR
jgi:threo-3-hydroxy-L-aspartate ammonia-lyase